LKTNVVDRLASQAIEKLSPNGSDYVDILSLTRSGSMSATIANMANRHSLSVSRPFTTPEKSVYRNHQ